MTVGFSSKSEGLHHWPSPCIVSYPVILPNNVLVFILCALTLHSPDVEIQYIGGADPTMIFLNAKEKEVDRADVSSFSEEEIMELLSSHGIEKKPKEPEDDEREDLWYFFIC